MANRRLYAPSFITVCRLPNPAEPLGLLLALLGFTTRIEFAGLGPCEVLEKRTGLLIAICLETSSRSISTVV